MRKPKNSSKLIVLDYRNCTMHVHYIEKSLFVTPQYLRNIGYNPDDIVYMFGDITTITHTGVLKDV